MWLSWLQPVPPPNPPPRRESLPDSSRQPCAPARCPQSCPLTFRLADQGLADHARVVLLVCRPPVHKEGRVGGPRVKHNPKLRVTTRSGGRGASAQPSPTSPLLGVWGPTLVSVGRRTSVASTRMRMSVVRPEATAAPSSAVRTRGFQVSPIRAGQGRAGLAPAGVGSSGHRTPLAADTAALESHPVLPGAQHV